MKTFAPKWIRTLHLLLRIVAWGLGGILVAAVLFLLFLKGPFAEGKLRLLHLLDRVACKTGRDALHLVSLLLEDRDEEVRKASISYLDNHWASEYVPQIATRFSDPSESVRLEALHASRSLTGKGFYYSTGGFSRGPKRPDPHRFPPPLDLPSLARLVLPLLTDASDKVRQEAVYAVRDWGDGSTVPSLVALLKDPHPHVRVTALEALEHLPAGVASAQIARCLEDSDANVRQQAAWALMFLRRREYADRVARLLGDPDVWVRRCAVIPVKHLGGEAYILQLRKLLNDPDQEVRKEAILALGSLGDRSIAPHLVALLEHSQGSVQWEALEYLGTLGDLAVIPAVQAKFHDADPWVRAYAILASDALQGHDALPRVIPFLEGPDEIDRDVAMCVLVGSGDRQYVAQVIRMMAMGDTLHPKAASRALARLGDRSLIPLVAGGLDCLDSTDLRATYTAWLMSKLVGEGWGENVSSAKTWWEKHKDDAEFKK